MSSKITDVTVSNFETEVKDSSLPVLIDFWSPQCGACIALNPLISQVAEKYEGKVKVVKVNTIEAQEIATRFRVRGLPTLLLTRNGEAIVQTETTRTRIFATLDDHI
jgi:thioredoxin 1